MHNLYNKMYSQEPNQIKEELMELSKCSKLKNLIFLRMMTVMN
jgi:hypothetical protein